MLRKWCGIDTCFYMMPVSSSPTSKNPAQRQVADNISIFDNRPENVRWANTESTKYENKLKRSVKLR